MYIYFLIDTSGSMDGAKIGSVNDTMENIISELKSHSYHDNLFINVLSFARKSKWMYEQHVEICDFIWNTLSASGMTSLGDACKELANILNKHANQDEVTIVLLSDGLPTDDFEDGIKKLNNCLSGKNAKRYAIALEGADITTLNIFTQNQDNVFEIESLDNLMQLILSTINLYKEDYRNKSNDGIDDEWA